MTPTTQRRKMTMREFVPGFLCGIIGSVSFAAACSERPQPQTIHDSADRVCEVMVASNLGSSSDPRLQAAEQWTIYACRTFQGVAGSPEK
jgi:hypothetical protein